MPLENGAELNTLVDVSGSQVGTVSNPFVISSSTPPPTVNVVNNVFLSGGGGADPNAAYVLTGSTTGSLPNGQPHETLKQLIHLSDDEGPRGSQWSNNLFKDTDSASAFPSGTIWWVDSSRAKRIVDSTITRNSAQLPVTIQWRAYAADGVTVVESYTDVIVYVNGVFEASRTRSQP
jgi:hypothetical protein